jgi:cytochrome c-type biogenesis protein CcmH/NrfF
MKIVSNRWRRTGAGLVLVWGLLAAGPALAEEPGFEPVAECPSPNAESLRLWIITQEAAGRSRADVEEELYARYGDDIRSAPRAEGFGLTAYVLPILAFVAGGGFLAWFLKRQTGGHADDPPPPAVADLDPELLRQVDEELGG